MRRIAAVAVLVAGVTFAAPGSPGWVGLAAAEEAAAEEPWYAGPRGRHRVIHLSATVGLGVGFLLSEAAFKDALAPDACRWCDPPGIDRDVRDALVWSNYERAQTISDVTGYVVTPLLTVGLTTLGALGAEDAGWGTVLDDVVPVLETVAISQALTQAAKFTVGRARPFVRFRGADPGTDGNLSFYSGHSALVFGLTVSAGVVAQRRGSELAPVIWAAGLTLATTTAYLRIAGDKHYFTDVLTGSAVGVASGLLIPRLVRYEGPQVVPTPGGVALVGTF